MKKNVVNKSIFYEDTKEKGEEICIMLKSILLEINKFKRCTKSYKISKDVPSLFFRYFTLSFDNSMNLVLKIIKLYFLFVV